MCSKALFSNGEISLKMEAKNQLSESEDEPIVVTDPITLAVNSGALLSEPQGASIARNRKFPTNKGVNRQRFSAKTTKASAWESLKEYPGQHFAVVGGKLRCNACSKNLSDKKSSLDRHTKSKKHETGLASIRRNKTESQSIAECLQKRARQESAAGSTLPSEIQLYRYELVGQREYHYRKSIQRALSLRNTITG